MRKENHQHHLVIAGVVAIVAIVALVLNSAGSLEGAAFYGQKVYEQAEDFCTDDDPQNDFYKAGKVRYGIYLYEDHCEDKEVHQHFCANGQNVKHTRSYECPNGCLNGACLSG